MIHQKSVFVNRNMYNVWVRDFAKAAVCLTQKAKKIGQASRKSGVFPFPVGLLLCCFCICKFFVLSSG